MKLRTSPGTPCTSQREVRKLQFQGEETEDRHVWAARLTEFCQDKYMDPQVSAVSQHLCRQTLRSIQHTKELDGERFQSWTLGVTHHARAALRTGKAAGGGDDLVPEMMHALPWLAVLWIHSLFQERYKGHIRGKPQAWRIILIIMLAKVLNPKVLDFK